MKISIITKLSQYRESAIYSNYIFQKSPLQNVHDSQRIYISVNICGLYRIHKRSLGLSIKQGWVKIGSNLSECLSST